MITHHISTLMIRAVLATTLGIAACATAMADDNEIPAGYYADQKVVYHNDGGVPDLTGYFKLLLKNLANHLDAVGDRHVQIRVVNYGQGVNLFQLAQTDKELAAGIDAVKARGVQFLICRNTLQARRIEWNSLYGVNQNDLVPAGVAELARLQGMGYAYIHP